MQREGRGHELEQTAGDSEGQGSLACCHSWGGKKLDTAEQPKNKKGQGCISLLFAAQMQVKAGFATRI